MKRRNLPKALVSSLAVLLAVLLTGCSAAHGGSISSSLSQRSELPLESASVPSGAQVQDTASYITLEDARQIALDKAGISADGVRWEDKEFDLDDGTPIYELEFSKDGTEYDCDVHAITGKVLDFDFDREDDTPAAPAKPEVTEPAKPAYIGLDKARQIALDKAGISADGVRWEDKEFDLDDGTPVYELEFSKNGTEYECNVHAITGKVLDFETDRDDDDAPSTPAKPEVTEPAKPAYIGLDKARQIALDKAGISADGVRWEDKEFDLDDGTPIYELEFSKNGTEYECDVHAITGKVLDFETDRDDAWDDRDDDDDDDDDEDEWDD